MNATKQRLHVLIREGKFEQILSEIEQPSQRFNRYQTFCAHFLTGPKKKSKLFEKKRFDLETRIIKRVIIVRLNSIEQFHLSQSGYFNIKRSFLSTIEF